MADGLPDLETRVRVDTSELQAATQRGALFGSAIGSALGGFAGGAISTAVGKISSFVGGSVDAFAELEDSTAAAAVVFGDGMGKINAFAADSASKLGISQQQAINAANTFGTFGKAAGLTGGDLASFSTELAQTAGDMASFKGTTPEQAIEAVGAALRGESEPIRAYGVLLDDASLRNEALKQGLISSTKDALTPQQKVLAAHALILKQTTDAQGDFARTSDSTANTQKRLAAETANAQAELGAKLAPALTFLRGLLLQAVEGLNLLIAALTPLFQGFAALVGFVRQNIDVFGPLAAVLAAVLVVTNGLRIAIALLAVQEAIVGAVTGAWAAVQAVLNAVMAANPIALVVIAIALLVAAVILAYRHSETFRDIVQAAWRGVQVVVGAVVGVVVGLVQGLVGAMRTAWGAIQSATSTVWGAIRAAVEVPVRLVVGFVRTEVAGLIAIWRGITAVVGIVRDAFESAREAVSEKIGAVMDLLRGIGGRVRTALGNLGSLLADAGRQLIQGLIDGITSKLAAIGDVMGKVADKIGGFLPGSPVREGPLVSWNNGGAGKALGQLLADGLLASTDVVAEATAILAGSVGVGGGVGQLGGAGPGAAGSGSLGPTWAPTVQVQGTFSDPAVAATAAMDELAWRARLEGATL